MDRRAPAKRPYYGAAKGPQPVYAGLVCAVLAWAWLAAPVALAAPAKGKAERPSKNVLRLLDDGVLNADLSAEGAYKLVVRLKNRGAEPLSVDFPPGLVADAFAQNQVLAQIGGQIGGQGLGLLESQQIDVAAGATVAVAFRTACLNYGVPEPNGSTLLFLKRVEEYTPNARVHEVLTRIATTRVEPPVAQAALWHVADGIPWDRLGRPRPGTTVWFSAAQLRQAQALFAAPLEPAAAGEAPRDEFAFNAPPTTDLVLALNPDPRGSKESAELVRQVAARLKEQSALFTVTYHNFAPALEGDDSQVQWSVLLKTRRRGTGPAEPVLLTLQRSRWDASLRRWQHERPTAIPLRGDAKEREAVAADRWVADKLLSVLSEPTPKAALRRR